MTRENKKLILSSLIVLVISALFITLYLLFMPLTKVDKMFNKKVTLEKVELVDVPSTVIKKEIIKSGKNQLGILYTAKKENAFGEIELIVALDEKGNIIGIDYNVIDQSLEREITRNAILGYKGSNITSPSSSIDSTGVSVSRSTVDELLYDIGLASQFIELDISIYEQLFGENYELEAEEITPTDVVLTKQSVKVDGETKAYVYTIKKFGIYQDENDEKLPIQLDVILDLENNIIGFDHQDENYKHSGGPFKRAVLSYLDAITKEKVSIHNVSEFNPDITNGTNSRTLVKSMLVDLDNFIKGGN